MDLNYRLTVRSISQRFMRRRDRLESNCGKLAMVAITLRLTADTQLLLLIKKSDLSWADLSREWYVDMPLRIATLTSFLG
jgi:hypothetical protein